MSYDLQVGAILAVADWLEIDSSPNMVAEIQTSICEGMNEAVELDFSETAIRVSCEACKFDEDITLVDLKRILHTDRDSFIEEVNSRFWALIGKLEFIKLEKELGMKFSESQWN